MKWTSEFSQNAYLCLATLYTAGAYIGNALDDAHPTLENKILKWGSFIVAACLLVGAKHMIRQVKIDERKKWDDLIDGIGKEIPPADKWKSIPQVY